MRVAMFLVLGGWSSALALGAGGCSSGSSSEPDGALANAGASAAGGSERGGTGGTSHVTEGQGGLSLDVSSGASSGSGASAGSGGSAGEGGPACPGVEALADVPGTTCRSIADCRQGAICSAETQFNGCGGAFLPAPRECEDDDQCAANERCVESPLDPCRSGVGTSCEPA